MAIYRGTCVIIPLRPRASSKLTEPSPPAGDEAQGDQMLRDFGAQFRVARDRAGLSQGAVADRLGVTQGHISQIESGQINVSLKMMVRLANAVGGDILLYLMTTGAATAEALLRLVGAIEALRPPTTHVGESQPPARRRRGRPQKID